MQRHALSRPSLSRSSTRDARRRLLALALALAVPAALALVSGQGPASAGQGSPTVTKTGVETFGAIKTTTSTVGWLLRCAYSHSGTNDPIMMPSMTGMSHLHDFFGNVSTSADSTLASMEASKTSCGTSADTAAYWAPALLVHGKLIPPDQTSQQIYYRSKYASGVTVVPLPQDLRVVVGSSMATRVADNAALTGAAAGNQGIYWECDGNTTVHYTLPPSCSRGVILENVQFPSCWNGVLAHDHGALNDNADLAYAPNGGTCPAGFPYAMPRISLKVKYTVGTDGTAVTLASGSAASAHADFWNTWQPAGLQYLVDRCINARISCGTNPVAPMG